MPDQSRIEEIYALSPMQQGMVFHSLREPDCGLYFESSAYRLQCRLDEDRFKEAWLHVVARHGILRTAFALKRQIPLQVVFERVRVTIESQDWRGLSASEQHR